MAVCPPSSPATSCPVASTHNLIILPIASATHVFMPPPSPESCAVFVYFYVYNPNMPPGMWADGGGGLSRQWGTGDCSAICAGLATAMQADVDVDMEDGGWRRRCIGKNPPICIRERKKGRKWEKVKEEEEKNNEWTQRSEGLTVCECILYFQHEHKQLGDTKIDVIY